MRRIELSAQARRIRRKNNLGFFLYMTPVFVLYLVFKYWPILYSFALSFYKWNFVGKMRWIGMDNYLGMFGRSSFMFALKNTGWYILGLFPFFVIIPLILAVTVMSIRNARIQNTYKAFLFVPNILAFSIICMVWMWIFNPGFGLLNNVFRLFGHTGYSWLSDERTALFSVILVSGWKHIGANMILFIAGLLTISQDYTEAATIDGANGWQTFWFIKWPLLAPTTVYLLTTSVIFAAERAFTPINILTGGGPSETTTNLSHIIYRFGFEYFNIGLTSATAIFTAIFFFIIMYVMMKVTGGYGYYEN